MHDTTALMATMTSTKQETARGRGYDEEFGGDDLLEVVREEREPGLGGGLVTAHLVLRHGILRDVHPQFQHPVVNPAARPTAGWPARRSESMRRRRAGRSVVRG